MVDKNKRFIYGRFHWPGMGPSKSPARHPFPVRASPLDAHDPVAIEILREYGANELIGKMYYRGALNQWVPIEPRVVSEVAWFTSFHKLPDMIRNGATMYYFEMEGSGRWIVLHFRNESDETGPYVAIALRYSKP